MSHAFASLRGQAPNGEICRAGGLAGAAPDRHEPAGSKAIAALPDAHGGGAGGAFEHCGYCLPHAGTFALPPAAIGALGLLDGHALRPSLVYRAPQPLLALSAAPARGPPAPL